MKKIIALEQKGFLDKGQELFEWEVAKKMMDEYEVEFFSLWSNAKLHYYFKNSYSLAWLSINKDSVKVEIIDDTEQTKPKFKVGDRVRFKGDIEDLEVIGIDTYTLKGDDGFIYFANASEFELAPTTQRYFNVYKWIEDTIKRGKDAKYVEEYLDTMMKNHGKLAKDGAQNYPEWCDEK